MSNLDWYWQRNLEKAGRLDDVFRALRDAGYDPVGGEAYGDYVRDLASERDRLQEEADAANRMADDESHRAVIASGQRDHLYRKNDELKQANDRLVRTVDEDGDQMAQQGYIIDLLSDTAKHLEAERQSWKGLAEAKDMALDEWKSECEEQYKIAAHHFYEADRLQGERDQAIYASRARQNTIDRLEGERDKARGEWKGAEDALEEAREEAAAEGMARRQADNTLAEIRAALNDMRVFRLKRIERANVILDRHYGYVQPADDCEGDKQAPPPDPVAFPLLDSMRDVMNKINAIHVGESDEAVHDEAEDGENHATFQVGDTVRVSNPRAYADYQGLAGVVNAIHHFPTVYPIQVRFPDRSIRDYSHDELSHTLLEGDSVKVVSNEPGVGHKGKVGTVYKIANTDWAYPVTVGFAGLDGGCDSREYHWHELERV